MEKFFDSRDVPESSVFSQIFDLFLPQILFLRIFTFLLKAEKERKWWNGLKPPVYLHPCFVNHSVDHEIHI